MTKDEELTHIRANIAYLTGIRRQYVRRNTIGLGVTIPWLTYVTVDTWGLPLATFLMVLLLFFTAYILLDVVRFVRHMDYEKAKLQELEANLRTGREG